jgi:hypothetical protein
MSHAGFLSQTGPADVRGPASSTDNALARFDGTSGKLIKNSVAILNDAGALSGLTQLDVDNIRIDGNTLSSTNANGDINLTPNGTGKVVTSAADINGGAIDGTPIGASSAAAGTFTDLTSTNSASFSGTMQYDGIAAGFTGSQAQWRQTGVQTTNATVTDLVSIALAEGESIILEAKIQGFQSDFSDAIGSRVLASARRATGGNVTLVGLPVIDILESDANTNVTVFADTVGQNLKIQVTGVATQTWNWVSTHNYHKVLTNS